MTQYILNAFIGAFLLSASAFLFQTVHQHSLNLSDLFWTLTVLKPKYLLDYLPLISGLFFTSGVLFDWMQYGGYGKMIPYGPDQNILVRTSMYGFSFGGFMLGFGSKLAGGDLVHHLCGQLYNGNWFSLIYVCLIFSTAIISSWLCGNNYLNLLTDQTVNPIMDSLHFLSANVTITISIVMFTVSTCVLHSRGGDKKIMMKKIGGSFASGVMLALAFLVSGLTVRSRLFMGLTPDQNWDSVVLTFLGVTVCCSTLLYLISRKQKCQQRRNQVRSDQAEVERGEVQTDKTECSIGRGMRCVGAVMQGMGWGIAGLQFTVFLVHSAIFTIPTVIIFGLFLILGSMLHDAI